jgi:hypothetical protein
MNEVYADERARFSENGRTPVPDRESRIDRLLAMRFDGAPFGELEAIVRSGKPGEHELEKRLGEKSALGHVLCGCHLDRGIENITTLDPPRPDFVTEGAADTSYVELARVASPDKQRIQGAFNTIAAELNVAESADEAIVARLKGLQLRVLFRDTVPIARRDALAAAAEIIALAKTLDLPSARRNVWNPSDTNVASLKLVAHYSSSATTPRPL